ncbi:MAG: translation initiation factor eIF-1A [Candidatus Bathyarchaeia archaeon]|nr:translation initiation factor eIF-1A [Candidatus Bathyarchaeota archaeon]
MGKKKVVSEEEISEELVLPSENDVLGIVVKMLGYDRVLVKCQDGYERICRIRGKLKRKLWIRVGDVVLVSPWDFQRESRGDVIWRYTKGQVEYLRRNGLLILQ